MTEHNKTHKEFAQTLKAMRADSDDAAKPGLDLALTALGEDDDLAGRYADEFASDEDMMAEMPPEPTRKAVAGGLGASSALLILWAAQQLGVSMDLEVALAIAGLIGGAIAYAKREW